MSVVSGVMGAQAQTDAANTAASAQKDAAQRQVDELQRQYNQTRSDYQPYTQAGYNALDLLYGRGGQQIPGITDSLSNMPATYADTMGNAPKYADTMQGRTWDETMGAYDPAVAVERERTLGLRDLNNKYASRGIRGANMANKLADYNDQKNADLSNRQLDFNKQRYTARLGEGNNLYSNTRNELMQGYTGGVNDWNLRQAATQDKFGNLLKMLDIGRGAQGVVSGAGQSASQGAANAIGQMGQASANAALAAGQGTAQMMQGIGQTGTSLAAAAMKNGNWNWGSGSNPTTTGVPTTSTQGYQNSWENTGDGGFNWTGE